MTVIFTEILVIQTTPLTKLSCPSSPSLCLLVSSVFYATTSQKKSLQELLKKTNFFFIYFDFFFCISCRNQVFLVKEDNFWLLAFYSYSNYLTATVATKKYEYFLTACNYLKYLLFLIAWNYLKYVLFLTANNDLKCVPTI